MRLLNRVRRVASVVGVGRWWMLTLALLSALAAGRGAQAQVRACCIGSTCTLRTQTACEDAGGDWLGTGSSCSPNPCASPPGTCCNGATCTLQTDAACASGGGSFLGGTTCAPNPCSGSCCNNGNCALTSSSSCISSGGTWKQFGTCSTNICPGPCCRNGTCTVTVQSLCTTGGVWTPGSACFPNPCAAPQCQFNVTGNTGGPTTAVARVGTTGLLVARGLTLEMYNAVNVNAPVPFSPPRRILLPAPAVKISMSAGSSRAFVLLNNDDIFYVTVLTSPQLLLGDTGLIGGSGVNDIQAEGDRVYIPRTLDELHGVDSDVFIYERGADGFPRLLGQFEPTLQNFAIDRIAKAGNVLWLGMHFYNSSTYLIEGWDVSNPAAPVFRGAIAGFADLNGETEITGMQAIGTKLLVSFYNLTTGPGAGDQLRAADVTNPASPAWHPEVNVNGSVQCMSANGNHLRVGLGSSIQTWDTTNPASLTLLGTLANSPVLPAQITSGASTDYIAAGEYGLQTATFIVPASPQFRATVTTFPGQTGLVRQFSEKTVVYDYAFDTVRVFDYTLMESQQLRGSLAVNLPYADMMELTLVNGGTQLLACLGSSVDGRILIVDVTSSTAPVLRATLTTASCWKMSVTSNRLYVLSSSSELKIYDLANAAAPSLLSTTPYGGTRFDYTCMSSWLSGGTHAVAIGTADFGLWLVNATNGASPQVSAVHSPVTNYRVEAVTKGPNFLYVSSSATFADSRLESLQVANLASPIVSYVTGPELGAGEPGTFESLAYITGPSGRFLIGLSPSGASLALMDLTSPLGEAVIHRIFSTSVPPSSPVFAVRANGASVLLAASDGGLQQVSMPQTWAPGFSSPAYITQDACLGGSIAISTQASANPSAITYQWFRDGNTPVALTNGPTSSGSAISGATTPNLTISNIRPQEDFTFYYCVATNSCGSRESASVRLEICIADINCSGTVTVQDIFDFLSAYFTGNTLADVNGAGGLSVQDIFDFLAVYFAGCL